MPKNIELIIIGLFFIILLIGIISFSTMFNIPIGLFRLGLETSTGVEPFVGTPFLLSLNTGQKINIYGSGLVASLSSNGVNYYHSDHLGSNRIVSNENTEIIDADHFSMLFDVDMKLAQEALNDIRKEQLNDI